MKDVSSVNKWYSHNQFKPENQVKKSHHGVLRRPSLANSTKLQSSIQMLMPSNGQRIAQKHMKEASPSYQTGHPAPTTWNEKVPWLVLVCSPNEHRSHTSMLPHRHIWKPSRENCLWLQWHAHMLSLGRNGDESNSHVVPVSPCPPDIIWMQSLNFVVTNSHRDL